MIVATRATAGPTPHCLKCGAKAHFIDLNASWRASCKCFADLVTVEQLEREVVWAQDALEKAKMRLAAGRASSGGPASNAPTAEPGQCAKCGCRDGHEDYCDLFTPALNALIEACAVDDRVVANTAKVELKRLKAASSAGSTNG